MQHERGEVRQMCSALLNNFSLLLAAALPDAREGQELSDEATQILFGALDGLQDETSQVRAAEGSARVSLYATPTLKGWYSDVNIFVRGRLS